jgi:tetratricopeptide (TPR) repeat protein
MSWPGLGGPTFADDLAELIKAWIEAHPNAKVIPVSKTSFDDAGAFVYCWIVDGTDSLNVHLVRRGACQSDNMLFMTSTDDLLMPESKYEQFQEKVREAERLAMEERIGVWALREMDSEYHWKKASQLKAQERFREAIPEFQIALERGCLVSVAWSEIADCYDKLGDYPKALAAYDKALEDPNVALQLVLFDKASCIARNEGLDRAVAWLRGELASASDPLDVYQTLCTLYASNQKLKEGADVLIEGIDEYCRRKGIEFDENDRIVWRGTTEQFLDVQSLKWALSNAGFLRLETNDHDEAMQCATRALSIAQHMLSTPRGRTSPAIAEAGDFDCRILRGKIFIRRGAFASAKAEFDHAKLLVDVKHRQGSRVEQIIDAAYAELRAAFPDQKVTIPSAPKKLSHTYFPEAADDELRKLAAGNDPESATSALLELRKRLEAGTLSDDVLRQVIIDGLSIQEDVGRLWQPLYGILIEHAWTEGILTRKQVSRYARQILAGLSLDVSYHQRLKEGTIYVSLEAQERIGGGLWYSSSGQENSTGLLCGIRFDKPKLDETELDFQRDEFYDPSSQELRLPQGSFGPGFALKISEPLQPGNHRLSVRCHMAIKIGPDRDRYPRPQGRSRTGGDTESALPPTEILTQWTVELEGEFVVPDEGRPSP